MNKAFTLIELLVVVLIIGILAAIALPQYQKAVLKSHFVQTKALAETLAKAQNVYYLANGFYSQSFHELDVDTPPYTSEADSFTNKGVNRPHRFFSWGHCVLWEPGVSCKYKKVAYYTAYGFPERMCTAYNADLSSTENTLCKNETGKETPDVIGDGYIQWIY